MVGVDEGSMILKTGRFQDVLPSVEGVTTFFTDPPYNLGFDYGPVSDKVSEDEYRGMFADLMSATYGSAKDDANLFILHYPEALAALWGTLNGSEWEFKQWLTWTYPTNVPASTKWPRGTRAILWFTKGKPAFDLRATTQPYRNPGDKRIKKLIEAGSAGAPLYDWWDVNLVKKGSREHNGYSNQIPSEIIKRCVLATTQPGDTVYDPFAGTGSTAKAAESLGRVGMGCDANPEASKYWGMGTVAT